MPCYLCGTKRNLTIHHYYWPLRKFGVVVNSTIELCKSCHNFGKESYHGFFDRHCSTEASRTWQHCRHCRFHPICLYGKG